MTITRRLNGSFRDVVTSIGPEMDQENEHIIRLNFNTGGQVYIPSVGGLQYPPGATVSGARIAVNGISAITENAGVTTNIASIGGTTIKIVDVDYALAQTFGEKLAAGVGSRHKRVEIFAQHPSAAFSEDNLIYTFILEGYENTKDGKTKILSCHDIARETSNEIFGEKSWPIVRTINEDSTGILLKATAADDFRFERGMHDNRYPNETVGYLRIGKDGEIFSYALRYSVGAAIGEEWYEYVVKDRGLFGTVPKVISIDPEAPVENNEKVYEHVYYQEDVRDALLMATIGRTYGGRLAPSHWTAGVDEFGVDIHRIATSRFTHLVEVEAPPPMEAKTFYETYLLSTMSDSVFNIDPKGALSLLPIDPAPPDANATETFDETNIDLSSVSPFVVRQDNLADPITILWDYNAVTDDYENQLIATDLVAVGTHGKSEPLTIELPAFHTGTHTEPQVAQKMISAAERYSNPTVTIGFDALPSMRMVKTGTLARVTLPPGVVIDDTTGEPIDLDRTFLIIGRRYNPITRRVRYFCWGTSGKAIARAASTLPNHIPDAEYRRGAFKLTDFIPVLAGIAQGSHSIPPGKYYYDGNLVLAPDFSCTFTRRGPKMQLCVVGSLIVRAPVPFVCKGMGPHKGGRGAVSGEVHGQPGHTGYIGTSRAGGGLQLDVEFNVGLNFTAVSRQVTSLGGVENAPGRVVSVPAFNLSLNNDQFSGVPVDLSGCGGAGSSAVWENDKGWDAWPTYGLGVSDAAQQALFDSWGVVATRQFKAAGRDGAYGGMGLEFWSRGGGWDGAGGVEISGGDAAAYTGSGYAGFIPGAPGRSWPGVFVWIVDDPSALLPDMGPDRVKAFTGEVHQGGEKAPAWRFSRPLSETSPNLYSARSGVAPRSNLAATAARAQYSPKPASTVRRVSSIFSSLAIYRQQTGSIKLRITDSPTVPPSDGLPGDLGIWRSALEGNAPNPAAWIMNDQFQWVVVDWDNVESDYRTLLYVNRTFGGTESILSPTRPTGKPAGTHWLNSTDGTEWILGATAADDIAFRDRGVPVGIELLNNGNFAEGDVGYIFTRDGNLAPQNILAQIESAIRDAFITHGAVEGEYIGEVIAGADTEEVPAPTSLSASVISDTVVLLSWTQPSDTTGVAGQEILISGTVLDATWGSSYFAEGLTPGAQYTFQVRNAGNNGTRSASVSVVVTTTDGTPVLGQTGIVFTHTGEAQTDGTRKVAGLAYQNDESIPIADGRQFSFTLFDSSVLTTNVSGSSGAFELFISSAYDNNLGKLASAYASNGTDATKAQREITYEL